MRLLPSSAAPPEDPPELIFQWERRTRAHWRLGGIVALSLLVHALSFYVLQVSYTPTGSQLPPPAQVVMIPSDGPDHDALARWLAMADPSLIVQPQPPSPAETLAILNFQYVPSYKAIRPGFKSMDASPGESRVTEPPRPRPPGPVPMNLAKIGVAPTGVASPKSPATRVLLTGGIESRLPGVLPPIAFATPLSGKKFPESTFFLVGIRPEGGVPFLFQESKPDNTAADTYARDYLAGLDFRPADPPLNEVVWGHAEFAWGNDIYH